MTTLQRRLGTGGAVVIGLASMMGAGVFFVWAPAAQAAGSGLIVGLVIAGLVATLNALSSAQLAMVHPVSGGTYAYARATVGPWTGFAAGWLFLAGKTASVGAIALVAGGYLWPEYARAVAIAAVVVFAVINMTGIRSTAAVSTVIVAIVFVGLGAMVVAALGKFPATPPIGVFNGGVFGILQSAGLLFFCFAGYARMATLGEEVREPNRTIPRAILAALAIVLVVYAFVGALCLLVLGPDALAASVAPLADLVGAASPLGAVVRVVAGIACLGSLVGILAGLSRTSLAMARERDLPPALAFISGRTHAPMIAEATFAVLAIVGILVLDPARLVGFSSCAVLVYYGIAHLSAFRQPVGERWLPRVVQVVGMAGCLLLAVTLPWQAVVYAAGVLAIGMVLRMMRRTTGDRDSHRSQD
ncbi:APA family basic amino acid/polyamine antiporter [Cryobacterium mesophilum]|uniref:APC family permease n=1 Tax=Terrimesophilobacter mesophilus TaxID=433647 RepID=A0A4R8VAU7_9MICO|nr:APC family permease [Terrimesophilobacter mesophilus]MBB5633702.1 APA family basic amino acid/polyamine antiporter [Terrimesophilobacter mesophilus]TFB80391.1 APC family permease [Terrimesophilobacter mesophilus]